MPRKKTDLKPVPDPADSPEVEPDPPEADAPANPDTPDPAAPANGVMILKVETEDGGITAQAVAVGDVRVTEIATLVEMGLAAWRAKIGLDG